MVQIISKGLTQSSLVALRPGRAIRRSLSRSNLGIDRRRRGAAMAQKRPISGKDAPVRKLRCCGVTQAMLRMYAPRPARRAASATMVLTRLHRVRDGATYRTNTVLGIRRSML